MILLSGSVSAAWQEFFFTNADTFLLTFASPAVCSHLVLSLLMLMMILLMMMIVIMDANDDDDANGC